MGTVGGAPYYSYLNQLQGIADTTGTTRAATSTPASSTATTTPATTTTTPATNSTNTASALASSLLGNGTTGFSSEVLSLLQQNSTGSFDPITSLLGGEGTNDALTSIYANLFASSTAASLQTAQDNGSTIPSPAAAASAAQASPVQNLIDASVQSAVAYNQTIQQNAQNVIAANSYQPDGVTPLVA